MVTNDDSLEKSLKLVRALKNTERLQLPQETLATIRNEILQYLNDTHIPGPKTDRAGKGDAKASATAKSASREQIQAAIKEKIANKSTWQDISPLLWNLVKLDPSAKVASQVIEIAFLVDGAKQAATCLNQLLDQRSADFYRLIHKAVRQEVSSHLWEAGTGAALWKILFESQGESWLSKFERFFVFHFLLDQGEDALCFYFFQKNEALVISAAATLSQKLLTSVHSVHLKAAQCAARLGRSDDVGRLLKDIPSQADEYAGALRLLHEIGTHPEFLNASSFEQAFIKTSSPEAQAERLRSALVSARVSKPRNDRDILILNAFLADPFKHVAKNAGTWEIFSKLLIEFSELEPVLPNIFTVFYSNALTLLPIDLDLSLWRPLLRRKQPGFLPETLVGLAHLHYFLCNLSETNDQELFAARDLMIRGQALQQRDANLPKWNSTWAWALQVIQNDHKLLSQRKQHVIYLMQAAQTPAHLTPQDMICYLNSPQASPPQAVLEHFRLIAEDQHAQDLEILVLQKMRDRGEHFTNLELKRLWGLCCNRHRHDLAWRCATILKLRINLPEPVKLAWLTSGEQKRSYPVYSPAVNDFDLCLCDYGPLELRLVWACLKLGFQIPTLLASEDKQVILQKHTLRQKKDHESLEIARALNSLKYLGEPKKDYKVTKQMSTDGYSTPEFAEILLQNTWSRLVAMISHRMGLPAWDWSLSKLHHSISELKNQGTKTWQPFAKDHETLPKWLKGLSSEQRGAWHDLLYVCEKMSDQRAFDALSVFVVRMATLIYQNHFEALDSLKKMRAPVWLIWKLENWVLSLRYSNLRKVRQLEHQIEIPESLVGTAHFD